MDKKIKFEIVTPEKVVVKESVLQVMVPTKDGEITILPKHTPLVASLKTGVIEIKKEDGSNEVAFVSGGFVEVLHNKIVVLADSAERAAEIDINIVEKARAKAEKEMKELRHSDTERFANINSKLEMELARTKAVKRWKNIKIR